MRSPRIRAGLAGIFLIVGCSDSSCGGDIGNPPRPSPQDGSAMDATIVDAVAEDALENDGSVSRDGEPDDASVTTDGGPLDAEAMTDGGPLDTGVTTDGGPLDTGVATDGGLADAATPNVGELAGLDIVPGTLVPIFAPNQKNYAVALGHFASTVRVRPTAQDVALDVIRVQSVVVASGSFSAAIALPVGPTSIVVSVSHDGGPATDYTVVVTRAAVSSVAEAILEASTASASDNFAQQVAIDTDTIVVGAPNDDGGLSDSGAAYVFTRGTIGSWTQTSKIKPSGVRAGDACGRSVAIHQDRLVLGCPGDDTRASNAGALYVFTRQSSGAWAAETKLMAPTAAADDEIGISVGLFGSVAVAGAVGDDFGAEDAGAAHVFVRAQNGTWSHHTRLVAPSPRLNDWMGRSVAVYGNTIVVGVFGDSVTQPGSGAAHIFVSDGAGVWTWRQTLKATAPTRYENYGFDVALDRSTLVVGSPSDDQTLLESGAAWVYARDAQGVFGQPQKLKASTALEYDRFGSAVAIHDNAIVVGAPFHHAVQQLSVGTAYVFMRQTNGSFVETTQLTASSTTANDLFGADVAVFGDTAVIGAYGRDAQGKPNSGGAFVYR